MSHISHQEFLADLKTNRPIKIKVFNMGENLGMDFAYYCHYKALKKLFPNVWITLARSNIDETNCIGLDNNEGKVSLPVDELMMATVSQRYGDGRDWINHLQDGHFHITPPGFRSIEGYDYVCGIGMGESPIWLKQYPEETKIINTSIILAAVEQHLDEQGHAYNSVPLDLGEHTLVRPWSRTLLEYFSVDDHDYPFTFKPAYVERLNPHRYHDYIRLSLRWPDHVRWYYSVDRQFEVVYDILQTLRQAGKPVKVMFSLKDGEVANNFNRGQDLRKLRRIVDLSDECLFTYSWTTRPYHARASEMHERTKLASIGVTGDMLRKVDVWEDLLISSACKTYLSDPGGFAEVISMLRQDKDSTFLFPVSFGHLCTYITLDKQRRPIRLKVNPFVVDSSYDCQATLSAPDDPEGYRTLYWTLKYKDDIRQVGENCHGDDWKYFEQAQQTIFKDWYERSRDQLVEEVVKQHLKD